MNPNVRIALLDSLSLGANASGDPTGALARARNLRVTTGLPGGFLSADFETTIADPLAWDVSLGRFLRIYHALDSIFEGRIEDISYRFMSGPAVTTYQARVTALGPWAWAKNIRETATYSTTTTGNTIVQNALGEMSGISTDYSQITGADVNLAPVSYDTDVASVIQDVLQYGDSSNNPLYFAFWATPKTGSSTAGPRAKLWARSTTNVQWRVRIAEITLEYSESLADVYNSAVATYNAGANETSEATDTDSQSLYGERQIWANLSVETQVLTAAEAARDTYLAMHASPTPRLMPFEIKGTCRDGGGVPRPVCYVRAGDVMTVEDWLGGYTFVVGATEYHADDEDTSKDTVQVTPEERPKTLSALLGSAV